MDSIPRSQSLQGSDDVPSRTTLTSRPTLQRWATDYDQIVVFLCGHYEGFDERIRTLCR